MLENTKLSPVMIVIGKIIFLSFVKNTFYIYIYKVIIEPFCSISYSDLVISIPLLNLKDNGVDVVF